MPVCTGTIPCRKRQAFPAQLWYNANMEFTGISRTFSTQGEQQYEAIGRFWNECAQRYGIENLQGLGYNWTHDSIEYVIALKEGIIEHADKTVILPQDGWQETHGTVDALPALYEKVYRDGILDFEIETFNEDGTCTVRYHR